jgi:hypothetical protein
MKRRLYDTNATRGRGESSLFWGLVTVKKAQERPRGAQREVQELEPHARAGTPVQAPEAGDIVVVTIPLKNIGEVPVAPDFLRIRRIERKPEFANSFVFNSEQ